MVALALLVGGIQKEVGCSLWVGDELDYTCWLGFFLASKPRVLVLFSRKRIIENYDLKRVRLNFGLGLGTWNRSFGAFIRGKLMSNT